MEQRISKRLGNETVSLLKKTPERVILPWHTLGSDIQSIAMVKKNKKIICE